VESIEEGLILGYSSKELMEELGRVLTYPKLRLSPGEMESLRSYYLLLFKIVKPEQTIDVILLDPSDNKLLECALEADAGYIVSGDHHLLDLGEFRDIKIVTSGELLNLLST
jgi:putative PIN family toxin of toxin-antitoxin system